MLPDRLLPRPLFAALFALILLRALVPSGFMPGGDGWMQLCSFDGPQWVLDVDADTSTSHDRCFWDQALSGAVLPGRITSVASLLRPSKQTIPAPPAVVGKPTHARPPVRAPPIR